MFCIYAYASSDLQRVAGPFDSAEAAKEWGEENITGFIWQVLPLVKP